MFISWKYQINNGRMTKIFDLSDESSELHGRLYSYKTIPVQYNLLLLNQ